MEETSLCRHAKVIFYFFNFFNVQFPGNQAVTINDAKLVVFTVT